MASWLKRYTNKKSSTKTRGIDFNLTLEEYKRLLTISDVCDYTGIAFDNASHKKSIERVNDNLGYSIDNCCVVTQKVNLLKDCFVDKNKKCSILPEDLKLIDKIMTTLKTKSPEELTRKYKGEESMKETIIQEEGFISETISKDVQLATDYLEFSKGKLEFHLSFAEYKAFSIKKKCTVTGKVFDNQQLLAKSVICRKNETLPWVKDNVHNVCKMVHFISKDEVFNSSEISKFAEYLK